MPSCRASFFAPEPFHIGTHLHCVSCGQAALLSDRGECGKGVGREPARQAGPGLIRSARRRVAQQSTHCAHATSVAGPGRRERVVGVARERSVVLGGLRATERECHVVGCAAGCFLRVRLALTLPLFSCLWRSVARVSAGAGDWGMMNIPLRRRSSSSFTNAGREPMAASCCAGSVAARSKAGSNNDSGVSCKQPGRGEKDVGGVVAVPYTRQPKRKRHDVAHDSTRLGLELQHRMAPRARHRQGTHSSLASRYYATSTDCDTT